MSHYRHYFGFNNEAFSQGISIEQLYQRPGLEALLKRFQYVVGLRAVGVITGEIGSGKSTSLRYAVSQYHPSEIYVLSVVAHAGTLREFLRALECILDGAVKTSSLTALCKGIRSHLSEIAGRKQIPILVIDEAHLLRAEVFAHIHTLLQFAFDSKPLMPVILCGHNQLLDKLHYLSARPLASRVVGKTHLEELSLQAMTEYLLHHLTIAGVSAQLFSDEAILAIHQGSGGLLRKANILARGALVAAAHAQTSTVLPEHVRIASTEVI